MSEDPSKYLNVTVNTECCSYTITKFIAPGGNGLVYECKNKKGKTYVLKLLYNLKSEKLTNFKQEIKLQKEINSEYIVRCVDSGEHRFSKSMKAKSKPFYIMEKYDSTLEDLINENRITPLNAYNYSLQLCEALSVLHKHNEPIIHRDLKPENIMYDKMNDRLLLGDFGLAHIDNNHKTINEGFAGNIDYHAPEQKIRGKRKIGTYTDIYSLGLIINTLFTKEIAQGGDYKKVWQVAPYFSFMDPIVDRMIKHDISSREKDINSVIVDLKKHQLEYDFEKPFLKHLYKSKHLSEESIIVLMNLFSLLSYSIANAISFEEGDINLNYYCDYHFSCNTVLMNSILLNCYFKRIKAKFEYEGNVYYGNELPYESLDLSKEDDSNLYKAFVEKIDSMEVLMEVKHIKNIIKKYFLSLSSKHAREILETDFKEIERRVNYYCVDAPILCISQYVNKYLPEFHDWMYQITNYVVFDRFEESDVDNIRSFTIEKNKPLKELEHGIKRIISGAICSIKNDILEISFDNIFRDKDFNELLKRIAELYDQTDVKRDDILDILSKFEFVGAGLTKIYFIDEADANTILDKLEG